MQCAGGTLGFRGTPVENSLMFGTSSLSFKGSLLWNTLGDNVKGAITIQKFKKEIRHWDGKIARAISAHRQGGALIYPVLSLKFL